MGGYCDPVGSTTLKVLVTGSSGFLGRQLVTALTSRGDEVAVFDRVPPAGGDFASSYTADLASWPHVFDAISSFKPEAIFHTGALLSALAEADVLGAVMGNANGTFHVLEAARQLGVRQVAFTSTIATYGRAAPEVVSDDSPQFPGSIYGVTKVFSERLGEYYASRYGLDFRAIRFPSVIGPGRGDSGLSAYSSLIIDRPAQGLPYTVPLDSETSIPILYIDDAVRALVELSDAKPSELTRNCYLLAGIAPSAAAIAQAVKEAIPGAEIEFKPDPAAQQIVDSWPRGVDESAAVEDWRWKAGFDLASMVRAFMEAKR